MASRLTDLNSFPRPEEKFCDLRHCQLCLQHMDRQLMAPGKMDLVQQLCGLLAKENWSNWDLLKEIPMGKFRKSRPSEAQLANCIHSTTSSVKYLHGSRRCYTFLSFLQLWKMFQAYWGDRWIERLDSAISSNPRNPFQAFLRTPSPQSHSMLITPSGEDCT